MCICKCRYTCQYQYQRISTIQFAYMSDYIYIHIINIIYIYILYILYIHSHSTIQFNYIQFVSTPKLTDPPYSTGALCSSSRDPKLPWLFRTCDWASRDLGELAACTDHHWPMAHSYTSSQTNVTCNQISARPSCCNSSRSASPETQVSASWVWKRPVGTTIENGELTYV